MLSVVFVDCAFANGVDCAFVSCVCFFILRLCKAVLKTVKHAFAKKN